MALATDVAALAKAAERQRGAIVRQAAKATADLEQVRMSLELQLQLKMQDVAAGVTAHAGAGELGSGESYVAYS